MIIVVMLSGVFGELGSNVHQANVVINKLVM